MPFRLSSLDGQHHFELHAEVALVLGRASASDLPVSDPTISRRHAELRAAADGVAVTDLGSSNGTYVNGARVEAGIARPGDVLVFGKVEFRIDPLPSPDARTAPTPLLHTPSPARAGGTIVRPVSAVHDSAPNLAALRHGTASPARGTPEAGGARDREKLAILLEVSKGLGRAVETDAILESIVRYAYEILDVDRVAILLADAQGDLTPKIARDRRGSNAYRAIPQSIARKVVEDRVAILSDDAGEDTRFGGQSIVMQQVRSAMCCPFIGSEGRALGVLYVDNLTVANQFREEDLDFLIAFSGIAAVAIENSQFAERIRREMLVRSNFERFFAPALAERIAGDPDASRLGGDKRLVTVLFSDIRGFTPLSETMRPDEMAKLLTEYFTEMVECVFRHDGTLDKFIGDAVMAQWGAPLGAPDDADRAVRAALDMLEALERLNERWRAEGRPELQIGIGLNHGEAFAGNIGSERRLEFTVIGDTVNTAKRLCDAAGPGEILLSEELRRALRAPPALALSAPMELKGKSQLVPVYRVVR